MRSLEAIEPDPARLRRELDELEQYLSTGAPLKEREHVAPFFKQRAQLAAALGFACNEVQYVDRFAIELGLFGDFACDVASGDSDANRIHARRIRERGAVHHFCACEARERAQLGAAVRAWLLATRRLGLAASKRGFGRAASPNLRQQFSAPASAARDRTPRRPEGGRLRSPQVAIAQRFGRRLHDELLDVRRRLVHSSPTSGVHGGKSDSLEAAYSTGPDPASRRLSP
jgi:hypothetical protein